ncbi:MAG: NAD(P)-dependent oxidoreductase [Meiothermus sp.]|uniref:NAD(P)-dependent oxidoreductase n=1 Tax=Meiothermus sp. TaxID=1955249 RepID=UPI0025E631EA|nr:NAD(P)-dependent oxidoreductase [Meiothermus sp.]MCS7068134.1 NAD(P)-dependent oxidoreductase [Meiothermus sp.]MCX7601087.1 NAD(P)-dependent oxidoreductase [Meiothermus sp.]MDW8424564.1 NAD(P)-dependent oxidoreductase [Meiothermus sp.]
MQIALLGLGLMGRPMARVLLAKGFQVKGWNRSVLSPELTSGIPLLGSLEAAAQADVLLLMVSDSAAVNEVLQRLWPYLRAGQVVLDMGSSDPEDSRRLARQLKARNIGWVDAPVSGGPEGAENATLAIMAGGDLGDYERVRPILEALGRPTHVGEAGAGHTLKVINQLMVGLYIEAVAEALFLAERQGLKPRKVQEALKGGFADSKVLQIHGSRMIERRFVPGARVKTQLKDLRLAQKLAQQAGLKLPHLESALGFYAELEAQGDGDLDHSALFKRLESR